MRLPIQFGNLTHGIFSPVVIVMKQEYVVSPGIRKSVISRVVTSGAQTLWVLLCFFNPGHLCHHFITTFPGVKQYICGVDYADRILVLEFPMLPQDKDLPSLHSSSQKSNCPLQQRDAHNIKVLPYKQGHARVTRKTESLTASFKKHSEQLHRT